MYMVLQYEHHDTGYIVCEMDMYEQKYQQVHAGRRLAMSKHVSDSNLHVCYQEDNSSHSAL